MRGSVHEPVRPAPDEGLSLILMQQEVQGFDKLSPNGF